VNHDSVDITENMKGYAQPDFVKQIGKTTYKVKVHFSKTSKETMSDKIKRMLQNEVKLM
jgi:hypothetical protein